MCAKMKVSRNIGKHAACFLAAAGVFLGGADLTAAKAGTAAAAVLSVTDAAAVSLQSALKAELADDMRGQTEEDASPDYGVALGAPYDDAGFWCDAAGDRLLGTAEDVARLNEELHANQPSLVSLAELPRAVSRRQLRHWMEEAAPEREDWYAPTEPLSAEVYRATVENCAADKLPLRNPLRYGICVRRADLRCLPTEEAWLDAPDDVHYDILQATAVDPAEPLAVWSESADGKFLFVSMRYYRGWLARDAVALTTRETWLAYVQPEDFLVVTQNRYETPEEAGGQLYQLGSRIPLVQQGGAHLARLPQRAADGSLQEMLVPLPYSESASLAVEDAGDMEAAALHRGSLPYTANNLRRAAFACLGDVYGWGGQDDSVDCSSFVADVYRTVGIELARDADEQEEAFLRASAHVGGAQNAVHGARGKAAAYGVRRRGMEDAAPGIFFTPLDDLTPEERTEALFAAPPASLLFRPGHVMLTLGSVDGKTYVIHSLSGCWEKTQEGLKRCRIRRVLVSDAYFLTSTEGRNLDDCTGVGSVR